MNVALPVLRRFQPPETYGRTDGAEYSLLPIRFLELDAERYVATNFVGEHVVMRKHVFRQFVEHRLPPESEVYDELKSRHFLMDGDSEVALELLATNYRTKQSLRANFTSLFLFVGTLRCDHSCPYCQVSRQSEDKLAYDMSAENADRAVEFMFNSPSPQLKVEFQGGESLLNFDLIKRVVNAVEQKNERERRDISFVIATNLSPLNDEHLAFCQEHRIYLSTSLDGPQPLHDRNRPRPGRDSHARTIDGIRRARVALGDNAVAALMTTTKESLRQPRAIIDEYVLRGFRSIFLRSISPYGFAERGAMRDRYQIAEWIDFYRDGLNYILELNRRGVEIREEYSTIILRKMLTPWASGYVDLQSPAGIGISCLVFNYDGDIYASDEGRMLAEMGDRTFRLGNLATDSFEQVMSSPALRSILLDSMAEGVPMCHDCAFLPYCGSDPVYHHATQNGDHVGFKPSSAYCQKSMAVCKHLIHLLEDDQAAAAILRSWV